MLLLKSLIGSALDKCSGFRGTDDEERDEFTALFKIIGILSWFALSFKVLLSSPFSSSVSTTLIGASLLSLLLGSSIVWLLLCDLSSPAITVNMFNIIKYTFRGKVKFAIIQITAISYHLQFVSKFHVHFCLHLIECWMSSFYRLNSRGTLDFPKNSGYSLQSLCLPLYHLSYDY